MQKTLKPASIHTAIALAPGLRRAAVTAGNPLRREHLEAAAACGEMICKASDLGSFAEWAREALGAQLISHDGAIEAMVEIPSWLPGVVEAQSEQRVIEMSIALYGILGEQQVEQDIPTSDLVEICAAVFGLYALADDGPNEDTDTLFVDVPDILAKGMKTGAMLMEEVS